MKNFIFFYILTIFSFIHSSEQPTKHVSVPTKSSNTSPNQTPKHLQNLFEIYKELEHQYALNLFYSGTPYEVKPEERALQIILKNLASWNGFVRSRLHNKSNFNEEEINMIQRLQIHQKDAKSLIVICKTMNDLRMKHVNEIDVMLLQEDLQRSNLTIQKTDDLMKINEAKFTEFQALSKEQDRLLSPQEYSLLPETQKMIEEYLDACGLPIEAYLDACKLPDAQDLMLFQEENKRLKIECKQESKFTKILYQWIEILEQKFSK